MLCMMYFIKVTFKGYRWELMHKKEAELVYWNGLQQAEILIAHLKSQRPRYTALQYARAGAPWSCLTANSWNYQNNSRQFCFPILSVGSVTGVTGHISRAMGVLSIPKAAFLEVWVKFLLSPINWELTLPVAKKLKHNSKFTPVLLMGAQRWRHH